jgi:hypothetical protein
MYELEPLGDVSVFMYERFYKCWLVTHSPPSVALRQSAVRLALNAVFCLYCSSFHWLLVRHSLCIHQKYWTSLLCVVHFGDGLKYLFIHVLEQRPSAFISIRIIMRVYYSKYKMLVAGKGRWTRSRPRSRSYRTMITCRYFPLFHSYTCYSSVNVTELFVTWPL